MRWPIHPKRYGYGQAAYEAKKAGETWAAIGEKLDMSSSGVRSRARAWAEESGQAWPIIGPMNPARRPLTDAELAGSEHGYTMRARDGASWQQIAEHIGVISATTAYNRVQRWAENSGQVWPIDSAAVKEKTAGRKEYELRASGQTWQQIGDSLKMSVSGVYRRARRWAEQTGAAWPIGGGAA